MELKQFAEKYGNQATEELLGIALIKNFKLTSSDWRMFCIRHSIIKQSTKIIQIRSAYKTTYGTYDIILANGRGEWILNISFHTGHIREWQNQ